MSKLLKSKFLLGVFAAVVMFAVAGSAFAADGAITMTLKKGMKNIQVKYLQQTLNEKGYTVATVGAGSVGKETTSFGPATVAAVKKFQAAMGLTADGVFGAKSRAALGGSTTVPSTGCPAGALFNPTTGAPCGTTTTPPVSGPVSVMLSTDNPASGTIIQGQATADLMHVTFTGSGVVNSITLTRGGISDSSTLSNVYLYDGVTRLTDGYSFNTAGTLTMNNLNIAVNGSRTIAVKADVYGSTNSYNIYVALTGYSVTGGTTQAVNIKGNDMYIATGTGVLASIALSGSQQVTGTPTVNAGSNSYAVWRQAVQVNTRALNLKAANFRISGSAPADALANVGLYVDGVKVGNNAVLTNMSGSNYLSFDTSAAPVSLTTGLHTVEVRADIVKGSSFNFTVSLQQASDLMVTDPQVGVNLAVGSFTVSTGATITIGAGSFTLVNDPAFNALSNVTAGISNATIAKYKVHGYGEDVKVTAISVTPVLASMTPAAAGLQNVTLYFNGSQIGATTSNWTSGAIAFTPGSQMIIPANQDSTIEVKADLRAATTSVAYTAGTVSANLSAITAEGFNSHANVTVSSYPTGHTLSLQAGALTVAKNTTYANQSISSNAVDAKIGSFTLQNTSSSDSVRVTSVTVNPVGDAHAVNGALTNAAVTDIAGLKISDGKGGYTTPQQPSSSNTFSVDFTLAPGTTTTLDVLASTNATTGVSVLPTIVVTSISANATVQQNGNGTAVAGQIITISSGTLTNSATSPKFVASSSTSSQYLASPDGKTDATKATYNFAATGGAATITDLKFTVTGTDTVTAVKVGNVTAPVVGGVAWLQNLNLSVPNGGTGLNVDAYLSYSTVGSTGTASVTSGATSSVALTQVKYTSGGTTAIYGTDGTAFTNGSLSSNQITLTGSTPTVKKVSSPASVGVGTISNVKVGTIAITANDGDVMLGVVPVTFSSLGSNANWAVKVNGTAPAGITQPTSDTSGFSFANGYIISKGSTVNFDLYADVTNSGTTAGNVDLTLGASSAFKWSDIIDGLLTSGTMTKTGALLSTYNQ